ncbi:bifunctional protein-serine/threonine kinase/phosphatase [Thalassotalea litorea]|uniref:Bifunctional protein-serine/threonine kinase/phosphatase n=1 Tax=Thalassotalea litorea TaxID=2020715 RepID=A0A5R9IIK4_9GAMM|nr:bifunctional protein-serine/threonine kinase/phosphatase [Thalassotalea litorea]TLU61998.1 bifunctional protein-serine/threonine kinase/phosphatase [Thalassotalea litorea]
MSQSKPQSSVLEVAVGCSSRAGIKTINEDSASFSIPEQQSMVINKGICCALADGVSTAEAGKQASELAVSRFIDDYFLSPETWSVAHSGEKLLSAINLSLFKKSHEFASEEKGYLCTFVAMVFKSQTAHFFHVGDSRIYHFRNNKLKQLTRDHCAFVGEGKSYLTRALGMDNNIHVDYGKLAVEPGDRFLLSSDGLHDFVDEAQLIEALQSEDDEQTIATKLADLALDQQSDDNISCIVATVASIAHESLDDFNTKLTRLPFPPDLAPGMKLDGYLIEKELFASSRSQLYLVSDIESGEKLVMKTPSLNFQQDTSYIDRFIQEEWIGKRLSSDKIVRVIKQSRPRTCLYYVMEYVDGIGLDKWIEQNPFPAPKQAIAIIKQIAAGLEAFHEKETIHQDLKPGNILINEQQDVKIVDFGSTFVAGTAELYSPLVHEGALGTATYSDPQYLLGKNTGIQGDLYALATITYEVFTSKLPYGEGVEECQTAFDYDRLRYVSATYHNPIIPIWFDRALEKGVQIQPEKRYLTLDQFLSDLTNPNPLFLHDVIETKEEQSRVFFWMILSGFWVAMLILVFFLFKS